MGDAKSLFLREMLAYYLYLLSTTFAKKNNFDLVVTVTSVSLGFSNLYENFLIIDAFDSTFPLYPTPSGNYMIPSTF